MRTTRRGGAFPYELITQRVHALLTPAHLLSEAARAEHKAAMLREGRRSHAGLPVGYGSHDGWEIPAYTVEVTDHHAFPLGLVMADLEPIDADRAAAIAERVAEAIILNVDVLE